MASETSGEKPSTFLGGFASILSLLGITLFFSGWIYRWAYFSYFSLDVNAQPYSAQSFLIVPIQIYLGNVANVFQTLLALLLLPLLISLTIRLLNVLWLQVSYLWGRLPWSRSLPLRLGLPGSAPEDRQRFLASLVGEAVIVAWVLIAIFWLSQHRGLADARRDASEGRSTLPAVALVLPQGEGILAQDLRLLADNGEPIPDPPLANHALIGDLNLARDLTVVTSDVKESDASDSAFSRGQIFPESLEVGSHRTHDSHSRYNNSARRTHNWIKIGSKSSEPPFGRGPMQTQNRFCPSSGTKFVGSRPKPSPD
jgi:hypothetical protein